MSRSVDASIAKASKAAHATANGDVPKFPTWASLSIDDEEFTAASWFDGDEFFAGGPAYDAHGGKREGDIDEAQVRHIVKDIGRHWKKYLPDERFSKHIGRKGRPF